MNKKLAAKIQKLTPMLGETETAFSTCIAIEPTEKDLVLKKGSVYSAFNIFSPVPLNVPLISKVINDVLYDSYYHSENISPIQSLEKAVVNINEKISSLAAQKQAGQPAPDSKKGKVEFNMVSSVLWGNVLYMVQYGKGKSYLMREGDVKEVSSTSEGNFAVASGVVRDGDVIVLSTDNFAQKYPPDKLLGSALSSNDLDTDQSSIILKFIVDEEFTEDEVIDFNIKPDKKSAKLGGVLQGIKSKASQKSKKDQPIASLIDTPSTTTPVKTTPKKRGEKPTSPVQTSPISKKDGPNIKIKSKRDPKVKVNTKMLTVSVSVLLVISVAVTLLVRGNMGSDDPALEQERGSTSLSVPKDYGPPKTEQEEPVQDQEEEQSQEDAQSEQDKLNKVVRIDSQPFYDIKLADENANPSEIAVFTNTVVTVDSASGKIFASDTDTPKFTAKEQAFVGIKDILNYNGKLNFLDSVGYKAYNLTSDAVEEDFAGNFGTTSRYLDNVYSVEENQIIKYVTEGEELESSVWSEDALLQNAERMGIAYSIYVVSAGDDLLVFTQGEKSSFNISGLDTPLSNVVDLAVDVNFDYIYLADADNNRVVALNADGELVKQLKAVEKGAWSDIRSISVDSNESRMFILNGSKVFEVDLTTAKVADQEPVADVPSTPAEEPAEEEVPLEEEEATETDGTADTT